MAKYEDRSTPEFKAKESSFYGGQQSYNSMMDIYKRDMNNPELSKEEREYAEQQYNELYAEKRIAIDDWKEKHGQYDEARTNERIGGGRPEQNSEKEKDKDEEMSM